MKTRNIFFYFILIVAAFNFGCGSDEEDKKIGADNSQTAQEAKKTNKKSTIKVDMADPNAIYNPASLRGKIPANAMLYMRAPTPLGIISAKDDSLKKALGNKKFVEQTKIIQTLLQQNISSSFEGIAEDINSLFITYSDSPIELVLTAPLNPQIPIPNGILHTHLNKLSLEQLNQIMSRFAEAEHGIEFIKPISKDSAGEIVIEDMKAYAQFSSDGYLTLVIGLNGMFDENTFQMISSSIKESPNHQMYQFEEKIDSSYKSTFAWVDAQKVMPMLKSQMSRRETREMEKLGLFDIKNIAVGLGTSNQKTRLKIMIDTPDTGVMQYIYKPNNSYSIKTSGKPGFVASLSLPSQDQIAHIEGIVKGQISEEEFNQYNMIKDMIPLQIGVSINDIFGSFGPETIIFSDEVGEYLAIKINDEKIFDKTIDALVKRFQLDYDEREIAGTKYYHLAFKAPTSPAGMYDSPLDPFISVIQGKSHLYWIKSDGYMVISSVPQALIDRTEFDGEKPVLGSWLKTNRKQSADNSLLFTSTSVSSIPRYFYYYYIYALNYANDLAESDLSIFQEQKQEQTEEKPKAADKKFDIYALPTARQLGLPTEGTVGIQLDANKSILSLEITTEQNPLELLVAGNGFTTIATVGVLAAVALPAYQEYTQKAKISEAIIEGSTYKAQVSEYYSINNKFPDLKFITSIQSQPYSSLISGIEIIPDTGVISITLNDYSLSGYYDAPKVNFIPSIEKSGDITWRCESNISYSYLPYSCR